MIIMEPEEFVPVGPALDEHTPVDAPPWPSGPALIYIPTNDPLAVSSREIFAVRIDSGRQVLDEGGAWSAEDARRERMLLRALLNQALWLLGPEEDEG